MVDKLRSHLFNKLESVLMKISGRRSRFKQWYIKQRDDAIGRELVNVDKFGNKYYQYYSFHGLPTKRIVLYKFIDSNAFNVDPHFVGWLHRQDMLPPTPEELEKLYLDHDVFLQKALEWDDEQRLMIEEYNKKKKELDDKFERDKPKQLADGKEAYVIEQWNPDQTRQEKEKGMVKLSAVDLLEREYIEEYNKVMQKDKDMGKDFNKEAYETMKKARYYFHYLRTQEQLYHYEQGKNSSVKQGAVSEEKVAAEIVIPKEDKKKEISDEEKQKQREKESLRLKVENAKRLEEMKQQRRQDSENNRYKEFRNEYKDIFEEIVEKRYSNQQSNANDEIK